MSNFLNDITDAVKLISKSITDHLDSNQLKALKEIKMRGTAEISQIISRSELNRNRSGKEIFLAYFFRAISLNRVLNPRIKLVKFIIGNIEEMEPNNPMVDPLIYEYFIYSLIKVACLEIDNKSCINKIRWMFHGKEAMYFILSCKFSSIQKSTAMLGKHLGKCTEPNPSPLYGFNFTLRKRCGRRGKC